MAIADDISIDSVTGNIRWTGTGDPNATYTVIEFHRYIGALSDDEEGSGDDLHDIVAKTASQRSTDNIITLRDHSAVSGPTYNIDATLAEHLYDGSITQRGGDERYSGLVVFGTVEAGTELQVVQDNALLTNYWNSVPNADASQLILLRIMVQSRVNGVDIDGAKVRVQAREFGDTYFEFPATLGLGNGVASINTQNDINNNTAAATVATWTSITNTEGYQGIDIDGNSSNEFYYSQWNIGTQSVNDTIERAKWITRRGTSETIHGMNGELFRGITHQWGYDTESGTGPATNDTYAWGLRVNYDNEAGGTFAEGDAVSIGGTTTKGRILMVDDNGTTGSLIVAVEVDGTPADNDQIAVIGGAVTADVNGAPVGQATGGGVGTILAADDQGTTGTVWIQLLKGTAPADNAICYKLSDVANVLTVNGTVTSRTVSPVFIGQSTGSNVIGAFGIGFEAADVTEQDTFTDLTNTTRVPPNNVTFTVAGLVAGEDRILTGNDDGTGQIETDQFTLTTTLNGAAETSVVVTGGPIPTDTPATGTIRVQRDNGRYARCTYTSYTGSTFTIDAKDFSTLVATSGNEVFISYLDKVAGAASESFTSVYLADRDLVTEIRDGGSTPIQPSTQLGVLGSGGGQITALRTSDA